MEGVSIRAIEEHALLEASFEPLEEDGLLWEKNSVCYGREAALQKTLRELHEEEGDYLFDRTWVSEKSSSVNASHGKGKRGPYQ